MPNTTPNIKTRRTEFNLPCALTSQERIAAADKLGEMSKDIEVARSGKKAADKSLKAKEADYEQQAGIVSSGIEYRDVEVEERFDYDSGTYQQIRLDTAEVIVDRPMNELEKQTAFPVEAI